MATEIDAQNIEYVEYLDTEEYDENQEVVTIDEDSLQQVEYIEAQQVSGDVEYDADGVPRLEGHTIFEHNGRQYMIPNELHQSGQTIVLENFATDEIAEEDQQYILPNDQDSSIALTPEKASKDLEETELNYSYNEDIAESPHHVATSPSDCYMIYGDEEEPEEEGEEIEDEEYSVERAEHPDHQDVAEHSLGRRYAVLRDGRLHIEGADQGVEESEELEDKLQVLEESLNYQEEETVEITGKNLITGQTISLNGFLEKLKKKSDLLNIKREPPDSGFYPPNVKRQRRTYYNQSKNDRGKSSLLEPPKPNYVLMPPVNRKVLVGKTPDGKNIVGKILQIWKKIDPNTPPPKPRIVRKKPQPKIIKPEPILNKNEHIEELIIDYTGKILHVQKPEEEKTTPKNVLLKKKYVSKAFLDQNIVKTLSGLMELESVQKNLAQKNLIIKHILKKSIEGKIIPGKEITYYYGHMDKSDIVDCFNEVKVHWTFISDYRENISDKSDGIDLNESVDRQQVDLSADGKVTFGSLTEPMLTDVVCTQNESSELKSKRTTEFTETVPVNLIVIEDEYGKKRTKVTIPQLGGSPKCQICHKMFRTDHHLRRHLTLHAGVATARCPECERRFEDAASLALHVSAEHAPHVGRQHACASCAKRFSSPGALRRHASVHDHSLRPLQCMACLHRFTDESSLKKHMVLHTGIKPFQCETCLKCFVHQGDLNFHRKIHDPVKRYQCRTCGKQFNRHSNMLRHSDIHRVMASDVSGGGSEQEHTPAFRCDMCGCQYNFISSLTRHIVNKHMNQCSDDMEDGDGDKEDTIVEEIDASGSQDATDETVLEETAE